MSMHSSVTNDHSYFKPLFKDRIPFAPPLVADTPPHEAHYDAEDEDIKQTATKSRSPYLGLFETSEGDS